MITRPNAEKNELDNTCMLNQCDGENESTKSAPPKSDAPLTLFCKPSPLCALPISAARELVSNRSSIDDEGSGAYDDDDEADADAGDLIE